VERLDTRGRAVQIPGKILHGLGHSKKTTPNQGEMSIAHALAQFFLPGYDRDMKATMPEPEIVTRNGKPVSVIIPIKDYEELLERVEDSEDVAWLKRARRKPLHYRPLEDYLAERSGK
jgi:hypothetical protein